MHEENYPVSNFNAFAPDIKALCSAIIWLNKLPIKLYLLKLMKLQHTLALPQRHQSNNIVERQCKTLLYCPAQALRLTDSQQSLSVYHLFSRDNVPSSRTAQDTTGIPAELNVISYTEVMPMCKVMKEIHFLHFFLTVFEKCTKNTTFLTNNTSKRNKKLSNKLGGN